MHPITALLKGSNGDTVRLELRTKGDGWGWYETDSGNDTMLDGATQTSAIIAAQDAWRGTMWELQLTNPHAADYVVDDYTGQYMPARNGYDDVPEPGATVAIRATRDGEDCQPDGPEYDEFQRLLQRKRRYAEFVFTDGDFDFHVVKQSPDEYDDEE